jgi:hypothetical protein
LLWKKGNVFRIILASLNTWFANKLEAEPEGTTELVLQQYSGDTLKGGAKWYRYL